MDTIIGIVEKPGGTTVSRFAPYGQLVKMLLPSCGEIAIHDSAGELLWSSAGYQAPTLRALADELLASSSAERGNGGGLKVAADGTRAFVSPLRDEQQRLLGSLVVALAETHGSDAKASMIASLLRPVCECLSNRLNLERTVIEGDRGSRERDELLLGPEEAPGALEGLLDRSRQDLDAEFAVLRIPGEGVSLSCAASASAHKAGCAVVDKIHRSLLAWLQVNDRPMLVNRVGKIEGLPAYKILACPIRDARGSVKGVVALFRSEAARDFEARDSSIVEFSARRIAAVLTSERDALTGLMNRLIFTRRAQRMLSEVDGNCAVLYLDIDRLQQINDAFGLSAGDEVLERCGALIASGLAERGIASRVGGDRFAALLRDHTREQAEAAARELLDSIAELAYVRDGESVAVSACAGMVAAVDEPIDHLMAAAERACKRAKQRGPNQLESHVLGDTVIGAPRARHSDSAELQAALSEDRFRLDAQPMVGLGRRAGELVGYEVLVRLRDAEGALIAPNKFLDAAERHQLMPALDRWVLRFTLSMLGARTPGHALGRGRLAVNVSTQSLIAGGYAEFALEQLKAAGVSPELLCFELRESSAVHYIREAAELIEKLVDAGCVIALDDFGRGLSSLAHLKHLPVQYLKIDGGFVRRSPEDRIAASIVAGIAEAARSLGVTTIAEHVESELILTKLSELGVDYGQGFVLGRPQPLEQLLSPVAA